MTPIETESSTVLGLAIKRSTPICVQPGVFLTNPEAQLSSLMLNKEVSEFYTSDLHTKLLVGQKHMDREGRRDNYWKRWVGSTERYTERIVGSFQFCQGMKG